MNEINGDSGAPSELRRWHFLKDKSFKDPSIPKLHNLFRAARAGLPIPPTAWAWAAELQRDAPVSIPDPYPHFPELRLPIIVRSASPSEDTGKTSSAGQFLSLVVREAAKFPQALADVITALPYHEGNYQGAVFIQPLIDAETAGVTFFDGFYFEETSAAGSNQALTSGQERGEIVRGHLERGDLHSEWLLRLGRIFAGPIDIEWAIPRTGGDPAQSEAIHVESGTRVILQVRPALFPIRRNETLSLANHKEILGDPPSPWMVGMIAEVTGPVMSYFATIDPVVGTWDETYSVELVERAWLNFSAFFRLLDHWGLPRTMITEMFGGESRGNPLDARLIPRRFLQSIPRLLRMQWLNLCRIKGIPRLLQDIDTRLLASHGLRDIWQASADVLAESIQTMFALGGMIKGMMQVRRALRIRSGGKIVTQEMMREYTELAAISDEPARLAHLDSWLERFGHRGPLESDPSQPRFAELRETLIADLRRDRASITAPMPGRRSQLLTVMTRPFFLPDEWREHFKNDLMRRWQRLRAKILEQAKIAVDAGWLDAPEDVFLLRGEDVAADPTTWRDRAAVRRNRVDEARSLDLPGTSSRDQVEAVFQTARIHRPTPRADLETSAHVFKGIGLGRRIVTGTAVRVATLAFVLARQDLPDSPILVTPTLEPTWSLVFPRFTAIVVELGGELSHASILIRETGQTAVINVPGAYDAIADGATLQVDPILGEVRLR